MCSYQHSLYSVCWCAEPGSSSSIGRLAPCLVLYEAMIGSGYQQPGGDHLPTAVALVLDEHAMMPSQKCMELMRVQTMTMGARVLTVLTCSSGAAHGGAWGSRA